MATAGKTVVRKGGKRGLLAGGKGAVFNADAECPECCCPPCEPFVLASFTTNAQNPVWDLTPYQGPDQAPYCAYWRIIEVGYCYPYGYPWYGAGCVDRDGRLVGLPDQFVSHYSYDGYLELQIGCLEIDEWGGEQIHWPGDCQPYSWRFPC